MSNSKRPQQPKPRNIAWRDARLVQSNRNLTRPSGNVYRRPKAGSRNKEW